MFDRSDDDRRQFVTGVFFMFSAILLNYVYQRAVGATVALFLGLITATVASTAVYVYLRRRDDDGSGLIADMRGSS
ncbi:MAG: hypothetical protein SV760_06290 [Halobacteria archaeon]|nr:hypothetical protein [Halobacteria archaeon]